MLRQRQCRGHPILHPISAGRAPTVMRGLLKRPYPRRTLREGWGDDPVGSPAPGSRAGVNVNGAATGTISKV